MENGEGVFAEGGPLARELLRDRGLSEAVIKKVQESLGKLQAFEAEGASATIFTSEEKKAAEDAMWNWYLEWSGIARRVVSDGNLLRLMGFKKRRAGGAVPEEDLDEGLEDEDDSEEPAHTAEPTLVDFSPERNFVSVPAE